MNYQLEYTTDLGITYLAPVTYTERDQLRAHTKYIGGKIGKDGYYFDTGRRCTVVSYRVIYNEA